MRGPLARAGWDDLPGELHHEILRLVPLRDATAARGVSREMHDEVDEVWREWGIRATAEATSEEIRKYIMCQENEHKLKFGPLMVYACKGSYAHHLASMGLWRQAMLVAEGPDINGISWNAVFRDQSPLMVAVRALRPVGRGADGKVEWAYALGDGEVARAVRVAAGLGADLNSRLRLAWPLMTYCAMRGCLEAVKACLNAGAEVDGKGTSGSTLWTALVHAGRMGHEAVVELLLEKGASAKAEPGTGDEKLVAVCDGQPTPGIVHRMVEAGADVNEEDGELSSALHIVVARGDLAILEAMADAKAGFSAIGRLGLGAMHFAVEGEMVRWLAAHGASVQGDGVRESPLLRACSYGRVGAVRAMIKLGADVDCTGDRGSTALHCAVQHHRESDAAEMTRLLLAAGADVEAIDADCQTPLHVVRTAACVDLLLDAGADLEALDSEISTPIYVAATDSPPRHEVVLRLADRGAELVPMEHGNLINAGGELGLLERIVAELRVEQSSGGHG